MLRLAAGTAQAMISTFSFFNFVVIPIPCTVELGRMRRVANKIALDVDPDGNC